VAAKKTAGKKAAAKKKGSKGRARTNRTAAEKGEVKAVLAATGDNVKAAARVTGVPESSVRGIRDDASPEVAGEATIARVALADRLDDIAHRCVDLMPAQMVTACLRDLAGALKITVEMRQLLVAQPTPGAEAGGDDATPAERAARAAELLEEGKRNLSLVV
jgi:hypothetical protein